MEETHAESRTIITHTILEKAVITHLMGQSKQPSSTLKRSSSTMISTTKQRSSKRVLLLLAALASILGKADSFTNDRLPAFSRAKTQPSSQKSSTRLGDFRNHPKAVLDLAPLATSGMFMAPVLGAGMEGTPATGFVTELLATPMTADPLLEAELLNDCSHVALDLVTFFGPAKIAVRAAAVAGRLFAMAADYIPDHSMHPEEIVFQVLMLCVAWAGLVKAAMPMALSTFASNITLQDGKAFSLLFEPAGMTWSQFKALSVFALDWVTVGAGETITSDEESAEDDYIYWLYSGEVSVESKGKEVYKVTREGGNLKKEAAMGLLGESRLLRHMDEKKKKKRKQKSEAKEYPRSTVKAGPGGATVLRIHTSNLSQLMESDQELDQVMRTLLFQGMQDKLAAQLES